jgi:hypothetical protein
MRAMSMREEIEKLFKLTFQQDVFIVGGGSSLTNFDFGLLHDKVTVAINSAYLKLPNASVLYWCDEPWAAQNYDNLVRHPCKRRFMARFNVTDAMLAHSKGIVGCTYLRRTGIFGLDDNRDNVHGNNSGAHALNLIANMKPKRILLLGFDMCHINKKSHWHDLQTLPVHRDIYTNSFIPCIESMAKPLADRNIEVINCSIESRLLCFPKIVVEKYL